MFKLDCKMICIKSNSAVKEGMIYTYKGHSSANPGEILIGELPHEFHPERFWSAYEWRFVSKEYWQQAETMVEVLKEDLELQAV